MRDVQHANSALYLGSVMHLRLRPARHQFRYGVFSLLLDLDELPALDRGLRLFGYNRFAALSFHDRDHGPRDGSPLRPWVESLLARAGIDGAGGPILVHGFPRVLGYVFNPLTTYFCSDKAGGLRAILYEVRNTFGEMHTYLVPVEGGERRLSHACEKRFYVSPFIPMCARYRFHVHPPDARLALLIRQDTPEGALLVASHSARRAALSDGALLRALFKFPLLTLKVIGGIHWEAFLLWLKGARHEPYVPPPASPVTIVRPATDTTPSRRAA
ncbi:MAG: DUF1365 domain-containing protein [Alphaproteobacteria bacterium]|nr:DUF1365 domain-containing protein [Alphaproteobacteria bacterium]